MKQRHNLLVDPIISAAPLGSLSLPGVFAALARDEVESFPAMRPHQAMFWHMFCVQLGALAMLKGGKADIPEDENAWKDLLRGLTPDFPSDEPWCLVVENHSKPAFMQPPIPEGMKLEAELATPDALDLLITARNHDLKQSVAVRADLEDWIFALLTLQTGEGYGGSGNHGIARMNGGSSSRPLLTLAPLRLGAGKDIGIRPGIWFRRDIDFLLIERSSPSFANPLEYDLWNGIGLLWNEPWNEGDQFTTKQLDPWFIEICRRVRLVGHGDTLLAIRGTSKAARLDMKVHKGAVCDPWAPVHKAENKSLTLGGGDFDYQRTTELLFSGDWVLPILATHRNGHDPALMAVVLAALARGNSKTEGFKTRIIPLSGKAAFGLGAHRKQLHELAKEQVNIIKLFDQALKYALVMVAARGNRSGINRDLYSYAQPAAATLDRYADEIFFEHLWRRLDAQEADADARYAVDLTFARKLWHRTQSIFEETLPSMPCSSLYRPRAEVRARQALRSRTLREKYPELFEFTPRGQEVTHDG